MLNNSTTWFLGTAFLEVSLIKTKFFPYFLSSKNRFDYAQRDT